MRIILASALLGASLWVIAASTAFRPLAEHAPVAARFSSPSLPGRIVLSAAEAREAAGTGGMAMPVATLLNIRSPLRYGEFRWNESDVPPGPVWISIDLKSQLLSVFRGPDEIGAAVILYGAGSTGTPVGNFRILAKLREHRSLTYNQAEMPYTLRLTRDGVSIHGSNVREGFATHGCIGVPIDFAARLFKSASSGDQVLIRSG